MSKDVISTKEIGQRIRDARKRLNITQEKLAVMIHISESYMTLIEQGRRGLGIDTLVRLSEVLGITTDYILKGEKQKTDEFLIAQWLHITQGRTESEIKAANRVVETFFETLDSTR